MNKKTYEILKEYEKRTFIEECKISIPDMYKNNFEYIKDYMYEVGELVKRIQYIFYIIFRTLFILTSPISFPLGIVLARIVLKIELRKYERKSLQDKELD